MFMVMVSSSATDMLPCPAAWIALLQVCCHCVAQSGAA